MATSQYLSGRKKYGRPQAILWSDFEPSLQDGVYVPRGFEVGQTTTSLDESLIDSFIILSDDNRDKLDFSFERIEKRERMINGRMRSYHIADKLILSTSWSALPSRSFNKNPGFGDTGRPGSLVTSVDHDDNPLTPNKTIGYSGSPLYDDQQYTTDGGAGGVEMLKWYEDHSGPFWVYLAYDKYSNFDDAQQYSRLAQYNDAVEMYITDFSYSVSKRGRSNFDMWDISVTLEEV
jgi:hypothetical protein